MAKKRRMQKSFTFWVLYADTAQELSPRGQGELYRAIVEYIIYGNDIEETLSKPVRVVYKALKANMQTSKRQARNGAAEKSRRSEQEQGEATRKPPESQNETNISSKLKKRLNATAGQPDGSASVEDTEPPACPNCGRKAWKVGGRWYCPDCARTVVA